MSRVGNDSLESISPIDLCITSVAGRDMMSTVWVTKVAVNNQIRTTFDTV